MKNNLPSSKLLSRGLHGLSSANAIWVKVWPLATANGPISAAITKSLEIKSCTMESAPVVPDSDVVHILPSEPDLKVMVVFE